MKSERARKQSTGQVRASRFINHIYVMLVPSRCNGIECFLQAQRPHGEQPPWKQQPTEQESDGSILKVARVML